METSDLNPSHSHPYIVEYLKLGIYNRFECFFFQISSFMCEEKFVEEKESERRRIVIIGSIKSKEKNYYPMFIVPL